METTVTGDVDDHNYAALFSAVFGESDSELDSPGEEESQRPQDDLEPSDVPIWEEVEEVEGLWHCNQFLSPDQQHSLLMAIYAEGWFSDPLHNQAMRFGNLPRWAADLSVLIQSSICGYQTSEQHKIRCPNSERLPLFNNGARPFPKRVLEREPLFDQMIVNLYHPGEGISAHVDLLRFEDGIAILSLESPCVMTFRTVESRAGDEVRQNSARDHGIILRGDRHHASEEAAVSQSRKSDNKQPPDIVPCTEHEPISRLYTCERVSTGAVDRVDVLLNPGDLIVTHGPARYHWTHEITRSDDNYQVWEGQPIAQQRRISVTLRKMVQQ